MGAFLTDLPVLVLDCQATGPNPAKGHLLEVAWKCSPAGRPKAVSTHRVALPAGVELTARIKALTGLTPSDLEGARSPQEVWLALLSEAATLGEPPWPVVIHFARYELPFLEQLHRDHVHGEPFPFQTICTHEIAGRLLPGLPRKGLRAVAGYLGHHLDEHKRAAEHVFATEFIWRAFVQRLANRRGVLTLEDLTTWLASEKPKKTRRKSFRLPSAVRKGLPDTPGIYRMLGKDGQVLYVGKATSLRSRVNSHFTSMKNAPEKNLELYSQVWDLSVEPTPSALEAAVLEVDQIADQRPPYNAALKPADQRVWYCTADLALADTSPDGDCRWGPLPASQGVLAAGAAGRALLGGFVDPAEVFPGTGEWRPDEKTFHEGVEWFRSLHGQPAAADGLGPWVLRLGARLERKRREERQVEPATAAVEVEGEAAGGHETAWTEQRVAGALESVIRHGAALVRRGLWLLRLSEATLAWQTRVGHGRQIQIRAGTVERDRDWSLGEDPPSPAGASKGLLERQRALDRLTYDRLRVLNTELRRLVARGGQVWVRLGERRLLDRVTLTRALERV